MPAHSDACRAGPGDIGLCESDGDHHQEEEVDLGDEDFQWRDFSDFAPPHTSLCASATTPRLPPSAGGGARPNRGGGTIQETLCAIPAPRLLRGGCEKPERKDDRPGPSEHPRHPRHRQRVDLDVSGDRHSLCGACAIESALLVAEFVRERYKSRERRLDLKLPIGSL